jgi:hypothetical protein
MRCQRCGCLMSYEKFYGLTEDCSGWRCLCCGEIVDEVILNNRLNQGRGGQGPLDPDANVIFVFR